MRGRPTKFFIETPKGIRTLKELAKEYHLGLNTVRRRFERGSRWPEIIRKQNKTGRPVEYKIATPEGMVSISELADIISISIPVLANRFKAGWKYQDLIRPVRQHNWKKKVNDALIRTDEVVILDAK